MKLDQATEKFSVNNLTKTDFISQNSPEEIAASIDFEALPVVLTPYKSKTDEIDYSLDLFDKTKSSILRITPTNFIKNVKILTVKYLIVEDIGLMKEFGYEEAMLEIKKMGYRFIASTSEYLTNPKPLALNRFFVDCKAEFVYVSLFVLYKIYKNITVITKDKAKAEIFCKVMHMDCNILGVNDILRGACGEVVVVLENYIELSSKKVIYVGVHPDGCKEIKMDYKKVSKYIYRIKDVLKSITRDVLKGKRQFNYGRFKNILK
ncbi:hypothetical protein NGRA_2413 [Nosema granulosis]|uniref:Uncharacterized protein n=1 Tax=Nosema granulosis TaxID=83296 RepID=A0A9P6KXR2_9MICR|nr:hypothetical protein NGRA_2413 [Nosema granulosis]